MLNKMKIIVAGTIAAAAMFSGTAQAETATASAEIVTAATLTNTKALNFGSIALGANSGTVVVTANATGSRTCTTVICIGTTSSAADFAIGGANGAAVGLTLGSSTITLLNGSSSISAALNLSSAISAVGNTEYVGGTLTVPTSAIAGTYTGTVTLTAAYQ
jgi:Domain of unknown function (DUF4402)